MVMVLICTSSHEIGLLSGVRHKPTGWQRPSWMAPESVRGLLSGVTGEEGAGFLAGTLIASEHPPSLYAGSMMMQLP
ncbi:hypothetical protein ARTHRO8AJ_90041 [Arthrobacter sp. 8AJ]|nr:hypothetical protein ARTHRO8AJ_90041 [Arthrobacter sp. 8AJ]